MARLGGPPGPQPVRLARTAMAVQGIGLGCVALPIGLVAALILLTTPTWQDTGMALAEFAGSLVVVVVVLRLLWNKVTARVDWWLTATIALEVQLVVIGIYVTSQVPRFLYPYPPGAPPGEDFAQGETLWVGLIAAGLAIAGFVAIAGLGSRLALVARRLRSGIRGQD